MTPEGQNGDRPGRSAHRDHSDSSLANGSKRRDHEGRDRDYESRDKYSKSAQRHRDEDIRDRRSSSDRDRCLDRDWSRYSTDSESRVVDHNDLRSVDRRHGINTSPRGGGQRRSRSPLVRDELGAARHHDSASSRAGYPETDRRKVSAEHTDGNRSALSQCESIPLRRDMSIDEAIEIVQTAITKVMNSVSRTDCSAAIPENLNVACGISSAEDLPRDPSPTRKPSINLLITHPSQLLTQSAASSVQSTAMAHQGHRIVLPSMDFTGGLCAPVGHLPTGPPPQPPLPPRPPTQTISYPQTGEAALNIWIGQNKQDDIDIRPHKRSKWGPANSPTQNTARHQANLSKGIHMEEELEEGEERLLPPA